jgi:hypothetical protein
LGSWYPLGLTPTIGALNRMGRSFWECAMQWVTRAGYLAELNKRLEAHPDFKPGMRFVPAPRGAAPEKATGYAWDPRSATHPFVDVANAVEDEFIVDENS